MPALLAYQTYNKTLGLNDSTTYSKNILSDSFKGTLSASSGLRTSETDEIYAYLPGSGHRLYCQPDGQKIPNQLPYLTFKACPPKASTMYSLAAIIREVVIDSASESKKVLMVFKDSYANCFVPFLIPDYARIIMIDPRYYTEDISETIQSNGVTDILFLYNANTAAEDHSLYQLTAQ